MASFDYDVLIIGSGFGGSVSALRAAETRSRHILFARRSSAPADTSDARRSSLCRCKSPPEDAISHSCDTRLAIRVRSCH